MRFRLFSENNSAKIAFTDTLLVKLKRFFERFHFFERFWRKLLDSSVIRLFSNLWFTLHKDPSVDLRHTLLIAICYLLDGIQRVSILRCVLEDSLRFLPESARSECGHWNSMIAIFGCAAHSRGLADEEPKEAFERLKTIDSIVLSCHAFSVNIFRLLQLGTLTWPRLWNGLANEPSNWPEMPRLNFPKLLNWFLKLRDFW